ncbi:Ca2+:H+ antiporter [Rhizobium sp. BK251]|nr:Ca2+:H+ antiporter [Rhizobium sp. BK251]
MRLVREEWFLGISAATCLAFFSAGDQMMANLGNPLWFSLIFLWLFAAVLGSALSVVRHADHLAQLLGEPYGTLILTLSVTAIEVLAISAVMTHGESNPTLARDTLFAVIMIILNGMVGISLLVGAWRRPEQYHNLQGANSYLGVIVPLATLSLVLPATLYADGLPHPSAPRQLVLGIMLLGLYATFLVLQTGRHHGFFANDAEHVERREQPPRTAWFHALMLFLHMLPVVYLVEHLAMPVDYIIETLHAPPAFGGVIMAVLVATPEAISAVKASIANHLQRSINIFLGSVLSTIGLTVPAMLLISHFHGHLLILGLEHGDMVMLMLTLLVSIITFASGRTHVMQGAIHLMLFVTYVLLIFQP